MQKLFYIAYSILLFILMSFVLGSSVFAICDGGGTCLGQPRSSCLSPCVWTDSSESQTAAGGGTVSLENPLPAGTNINLIIGQAINGVLGVVGSIALVMVIYGGLTWMLAAGNQTRVQKGKDILIWAVVGLVVIFSAYALVRFLFVNVFGAAPATTGLLQLFD